MPLSEDGARPPHTYWRKGRTWRWEPPAKLRRKLGVKPVNLGSDQNIAWSRAEALNRQLVEASTAAVGTVRWLCDRYQASETWDDLRPETQRNYTSDARLLCAIAVGERRLGDMTAAAIRTSHVDGIYKQLRAGRGLAQANKICRFARLLWGWAYRAELLAKDNPWTGMNMKTLRGRKQRWRPDQVAALVRVAEQFKRPSVALAVLWSYELSHRRADVLEITWEEILTTRRETSKTIEDVPLDPWVYPELASRLDAVPETERTGRLIRNETTGRPYRMDQFSKLVREYMRAAGLPDTLQFRDLRATAVTELADAGVDVIPLSTHSGHKTAQMARHYARPTVEQFRAAAAKRLSKRDRSA